MLDVSSQLVRNSKQHDPSDSVDVFGETTLFDI